MLRHHLHYHTLFRDIMLPACFLDDHRWSSIIHQLSSISKLSATNEHAQVHLSLNDIHGQATPLSLFHTREFFFYSNWWTGLFGVWFSTSHFKLPTCLSAKLIVDLLSITKMSSKWCGDWIFWHLPLFPPLTGWQSGLKSYWLAWIKQPPLDCTSSLVIPYPRYANRILVSWNWLHLPFHATRRLMPKVSKWTN